MMSVRIFILKSCSSKMQLEVNWLLTVVLRTLVQTVYDILCSFYQLVNSDNSLVMIRVCKRLCFQCTTATDL